MAEIQSESNNRLLPMPLMPAWDVDACVARGEARRRARRAGREHDLGPAGPGFARPRDHAWDPFWEVCVELQLPVHFHIGASVTTMTFYGNVPVAVAHRRTPSSRSAARLLFIGNARVVTNLILSGIFDRHPDLKIVSVESGVGWIPFILEALDYEMSENAPQRTRARCR